MVYSSTPPLRPIIQRLPIFQRLLFGISRKSKKATFTDLFLICIGCLLFVRKLEKALISSTFWAKQKKRLFYQNSRFFMARHERLLNPTAAKGAFFALALSSLFSPPSRFSRRLDASVLPAAKTENRRVLFIAPIQRQKGGRCCVRLFGAA